MNSGSPLPKRLTLHAINQLNTFRILATFVTQAALTCFTHAATVTVNQLIPDNDINGLVSTLNLNVPSSSIDGLSLTLNISSAPGDTAWNGDFYAYLTHQSGTSSGFAVLLNRVGLSSANPAGYGDAGFAVTLSASAANDIHNYQNYGPSFNGPGQLTGTWQPDGRNISPFSSGSDFDSATRTANLGTFTGLDPNGQWVLFIADVSSGNQGMLDSWSLDYTTSTANVPEEIPGAFACAWLAMVVFWGMWRRAHIRAAQ